MKNLNSKDGEVLEENPDEDVEEENIDSQDGDIKVVSETENVQPTPKPSDSIQPKMNDYNKIHDIFRFMVTSKSLKYVQGHEGNWYNVQEDH